MAGNRFKGATAAIATGTSAKTLAQIVAAANHKVLIDGVRISFNGVSSTAEPIKVDILRQTTAGTMSALTLVKDPDDWSETMQTTAQHTATAEPTSGDVLHSQYVHPQQGTVWEFAFSRTIAIGGGDRLGVRVTAAASVNALVEFAGEE
jgi:hypothetical protein